MVQRCAEARGEKREATWIACKGTWHPQHKQHISFEPFSCLPAMETFRFNHPRLKLPLTFLPLLCAALLFGDAAAQSCSTSFTFNNADKLFTYCDALTVQDASIAWTLNSPNRTLDVLFSGVAPQTGGWVGWGINLGSAPAMAGTQAFIAFDASNGSTILTYNVTEASKQSGLKCTPISLHVLDMQVQISGTSIHMLVSIQLEANQSTTLHHVWNRGSTVSDFQPGIHAFTQTDLSGLKTIDMASGVGTTSGFQSPHQTLKNRHGVLNTVGWGILLPCGVLAARYLRFTDPTWFYLHVFMQMSGFILGVAGWATGLRLGDYSVGVVYHKHRNVGIALFTIATLQVTALLLRPKKDHKIRKVWNIYHYTLGTTILILGILNIFYGFDILSPPGKWRRAYVGVLIALGVLTVCFEIASWAFTIHNNRKAKDKLPGGHVGGVHSVENGYRQDV
ncbi:hypothetical protein GOP47_0014584 [Adiantum capillus-veneris]|uniref:Cytochrome b561 and DOMON domain-containing protein n=1 Tax=Adiantum capillus-veneris TaxID=13818 RepID=A0A9D4ZEZ2_ADICA|nr:hypothetical protein GOP47_0014584 [Adiantum capillus-veneris]